MSFERKGKYSLVAEALPWPEAWYSLTLLKKPSAMSTSFASNVANNSLPLYFKNLLYMAMCTHTYTHTNRHTLFCFWFFAKATPFGSEDNFLFYPQERILAVHMWDAGGQMYTLAAGKTSALPM